MAPWDPQSFGPVHDLSRIQVQASPPISPVNEKFGWPDIVSSHPSVRDTAVASSTPNDPQSKPLLKGRSTITTRLKKRGKSLVVRLRKDAGPPASTSHVKASELASDLSSIASTRTTKDIDNDGSSLLGSIAELDATNFAVELEAIETSSHFRRLRTPHGQEPSSQRRPTVAPALLPFPYANGRTDISSRPNLLAIDDPSLSDADTLVHRSDLDLDDDDTQSSIVPFSSDGSFAGSRRTSLASIVPTPKANIRYSNLDWPVQLAEDTTRAYEQVAIDIREPKDWKISKDNFRRVKSLQSQRNSKPHDRPVQRRTKSVTFVAPIDVSKRTRQSQPYEGVADARKPHPQVRPRLLIPKRLEHSNDSDADSQIMGPPVTQRMRRRIARCRYGDGHGEASTVLQHAARDMSNDHHSKPKQSVERPDAIQRLQQPTPSGLPQIRVQTSTPVPTMTPEAHPIPDPARLSPDSPIRAIPLPNEFEISHDRRPRATFTGLVATSLFSQALKAIKWAQATYGPEVPVAEGKVRVRWTCHCGASLYDDFIERRPGAARALEAFLNRPQSRGTRSHAPSSPRTASSSMSSFHSNVFSQGNNSPTSGFGSTSSIGSNQGFSWSPNRISNSNPYSVVMGGQTTTSWLLTCANEGRFTTKLVHLDMCRSKIKSDKDLALSLREHYSRLNRRWFRILKLRGLTTINFVQLEVHRNRFADIRKSPDMPAGEAKSAYEFESHDLIPPVGEKYLLHLFKHPEDYDGELITYLRSPKRRERLEVGVGWGINMVEGFLADRVWTYVVGLFALGSVIFAIVWVKVRNDDVQGAFGVAAWMTTLAVLGVGWAQACLD